MYVCNGKDFADWFGGEVVDGRFNLRSETGTRVEGTVSGSGVSGTLTPPGGSPLEYTAQPAVKGKTGLGVGDAAEPGLKRRWIGTADALRGLDGDGGGDVKNSVAVTQTGGGSTSTGSGGGGTTANPPGGTAPPGGDDPQAVCHNFVTAGCTTQCSTLVKEYDDLRAKRPRTQALKIQIRNYELQLGSKEGGCAGPPF